MWFRRSCTLHDWHGVRSPNWSRVTLPTTARLLRQARSSGVSSMALASLPMEKLVYLIWDRPSRPGADLRAQFLDNIAPQLLGLGAHRLQIDLDDDHAEVDTMVPIPGDELPVRACVSLWLDAHDYRAPYEAVLGGAGVRRAGYLVTESIYKDY